MKSSNPTQEAVGRFREAFANEWLIYPRIKGVSRKTYIEMRRYAEKFAKTGMVFGKSMYYEAIEAFLVKELSAAVRGERKRIMDLSYEATANKDWTADNHIKLCGMLNSPTQKGKHDH